MTDDDEPDRPAVMDLHHRIEAAIDCTMDEWDITPAEIIGILHIIAAQWAHKCFFDE